MGAVAPMLSLGAGTAQGLRRGSHRRVAYCGSRAMENRVLAVMLQRVAQCCMTSTPTKSVRLSVPVTPDVHAAFQRLANASGRSMAASMGQWLIDTKDAAEVMAENLERLRGSPGDLLMKVRLHTASVEDMAQLAMDEAAERFEREGGAGGAALLAGTAGGTSRASKKPLTPPSSNTGGKVHTGGKKPRA